MPDEEEEVHEFEEWGKRNKKLVRGVVGFFGGLYVLNNAVQFGRHAMEDAELTLIEAALTGGVFVFGAAIEFPWVTMPTLHQALEWWQARRGGGVE